MENHHTRVCYKQWYHFRYEHHWCQTLSAMSEIVMTYYESKCTGSYMYK